MENILHGVSRWCASGQLVCSELEVKCFRGLGKSARRFGNTDLNSKPLSSRLLPNMARLGGEIGRRTGLKILRFERTVPVRFRS